MVESLQELIFHQIELYHVTVREKKSSKIQPESFLLILILVVRIQF